MSIQAITWALGQKTGSSTRKLVLLKLADNANDEGICWPSQASIAEHCELTRESVNRTIRKLCEMGFMERISQAKSGFQTVSQYRLNLEFNGVTQDHTGVTEDHTRCDGGSHDGVTEDHTEPSIEPSIESLGNSAKTKNGVAKPEDVDDQVWSDFLKVRKAHKAALTLTAWRQIKSELDKGERQGYSANDMLTEMIARGWRGFKFEWYEKTIKPDTRDDGPPKLRALN